MKSFKLIAMAALLFLVLITVSDYIFVIGKNEAQVEHIDPNMQWEFFENQILSPQEAKEAYGKGDKITVPHLFKDHYDTVQMYGTYVAKVKIPEISQDEKLAVYVPFEYGSYRLYINNQRVAQNGIVGTTKETQIPEFAPKIGQIHAEENEVYVTLQLSNFYSLRGGFAKHIYIDSANDLMIKYNSSIIFHFFINGIIFTAAIFSLFVGIFNKLNVRMIFFALFSLIISIRAIFARPFLYSITVINIPWQYAVKIEVLCTILALSIAVSFFKNLLYPKMHRFIFYGLKALFAIQLILTIVTEPLIFQRTMAYVTFITLVILLLMIAKGLIKNERLSNETSAHIVGSLTMIMAGLHDFIVVC